MHSNFAAAGHAARERLDVPVLNMDAIRRRSRSGRVRDGVRAAVACAALAVGAVGAAAYGEKAVEGIRVWIAGGRAAAVVDSLTMIREPMAAELRAVAARATFPVVFPAGLPADARVRWIIFSPAANPTSITIVFTRLRDHRVATFMLLDPAIVNAGTLPTGSQQPHFRAMTTWRTGGEVVMGGTFERSNRHDLDAIKTAMAASSTSASVDAIAATLPTVVVLGAPLRLEAAERLRPENGRSVLIEPRMVDAILRSVRVPPIDDNRQYTLTEIPYVKGEPQYEKAKIEFAKDRLADTNGVRAIAAAARAAGGAGCGCFVLYNQPDASTYWVWTIPAAGPATKYAIDAKTFAVTRLGRGR